MDKLKKDFEANLKSNIKKMMATFMDDRGKFPVNKVTFARMGKDLRVTVWAQTSDLPYICDIEPDTLRTFRYKNGVKFYGNG